LNGRVFKPIHTARLLIRQPSSEDAAPLADRRSDPDVAKYQSWTIPYPLDRAKSMIEEVAAMGGPANEEWWMASVCDRETGEVLGDLALHLTSDSQTAEVGYTFATRHWGKGYAVEATDALVDYLFDDLGVSRVFGMLHPDNPASAMVLERVGMLYEGHTKASFWLDGDVSDDLIYGMTRDDREVWKNRPRGKPEDIELVEITTENYEAIEDLQTHHSQQRFVAPNIHSFVDAMFPEVVNGAPVVPWMRGVKADDQYAGFVMLAMATEAHPEPYLWRLLIDRLHQRRGIASVVMEQVEQMCRSEGASGLLTSWVDGKGSPDRFYLERGYEPTGEIVDGEIEGRLDLRN
jgi:RimJ/RimL family protein N-acetyltransferase/ribosomal protein S18 acetylase RimI-like enzyme